MFSKTFNVDDLASKSVNDNIDLLLKSVADFVPAEIIEDDKTLGWIANDFLDFTIVIPWLFKGMDFFLERKFQGNKDMTNHNSKACKKYLTL